MVGVHVHSDFRTLSRVYAAEIGFLVVGLDPVFRIADQGEQILIDIDHVAHMDFIHFADDPRDGRVERGFRQIEPGCAQGGLGGGDAGTIEDLLRLGLRQGRLICGQARPGTFRRGHFVIRLLRRQIFLRRQRRRALGVVPGILVIDLVGADIGARFGNIGLNGGRLPFRLGQFGLGFEFVRTIAVTRILFPKAYVRLSAGREAMSDELQALAFLAGANSIFLGDRLLTTGNVSTGHDQALFNRLGLHRSAD